METIWAVNMAKAIKAGEDEQSWLKALVKLAGEPSRNFVDLALALANHDPKAVSLNEVSRLTGKSRRHLYYLRDVGELIRQHHISRDQAERLGWTKLSALAQKLKADPDTAHDIAALIENAMGTTAHALTHDRGDEDEPASEDKALLFRLTPEQYEAVAAALLKCGATRRGKGLADKEAALVAMAQVLRG